MSEYNAADPQDIERYAKKLENRSLEQILTKETIEEILKTRTSRNKGNFGNILEDYYFFKGVKRNRIEAAPDFAEAGVELKATPLKKIKRGLAPKERLVLGIINYKHLLHEEWENCSFLKKNKQLLIIFYLSEKDKTLLQFLIKHASLWCFPEADIGQIKKDWLKIQSTVALGKAHELSEGDTIYLAAARKGHREQPIKYMDEAPPAKQRAFSLKPKYMRKVLRILQGKKKNQEESFLEKMSSEEAAQGLENAVQKLFSPYINKSYISICQAFDINPSSTNKNRFAQLTKRILGISLDKKIEEFEHAEIIVRTIRLRPDGIPKEAVSFKNFKYKELIHETWEESSLLTEYLEKKFFFVVYQYSQRQSSGYKDEDLFLKGVHFWNMPYFDREKIVRPAWEQVKNRIQEDCDSLLDASEKRIIHVRPHARNKKDTYEMPSGRRVVKKCFWLNKDYLNTVLQSIKKER